MIASLKALQLFAALGLIALAWIVYPGSTLLVATAIGLCYAAAAVLAMLDYRVGIWLAFMLSLLTALFTGYGVYRYIVNGFDFLSGRYGRLDGIYLPPYLFLVVAAASLAAVLLHVGAWRWMLHGRVHSSPADVSSVRSV